MNEKVGDFLGYLSANNNEGYLELEKYYHPVEIISFDIRVEPRNKQLSIHNVFYLTPKRCFENGRYLGCIPND